MKGFLQRKTRKRTGFTSFKGFIFLPPPSPFLSLFFSSFIVSQFANRKFFDISIRTQQERRVYLASSVCTAAKADTRDIVQFVQLRIKNLKSATVRFHPM